MEVKPSSAPNVFGSPSWTGYLANAMSSLENNSGNIGNRATDPTAYEILGASTDARDLTVSSFNSWRGVANPGTPFGSELGNRLHFGLHITSDTYFQPENLTFSFDSDDPSNVLDFSGNFTGLSFSATRWGFDWVDGIKGNGNDIFYNSGTLNTNVNEFVYVGVGNAYDASFEAGPTNQGKMDQAMQYSNDSAPYFINMLYELTDDSANLLGSGTASILINAVPELGAFARGLVVTVMFAMYQMRRRRLPENC
jgi:hypothetical protein